MLHLGGKKALTTNTALQPLAIILVYGFIVGFDWLVGLVWFSELGAGPHSTVQADLDHTISLRRTSKSQQFSCLGFLSVGNPGMSHCAQALSL